MHASTTLTGIALVILGYGYFSRLLGRYNITGPMVFTTVGVILSPLVLGKEPIHVDAESVKLVGEIALILVLFADAAGIDLQKVRQARYLPFRLLFVALPMTILFAAIAAKWCFPHESLLYLLMMALVLAPTDAALGKAVVVDQWVPETIRNTLNVESGLNDGIVFPLFITVVAMITGSGSGEGWLLYLLRQILFGAVIGGLIGWGGAKLANFSLAKKWMEHQYTNLIPIALAIFGYFFAEGLGGNGFIAAYFAGLYLGNTSETMREHVEDFAESEGEFLVMVSFLVFGLVFIPATIDYWNLKVFCYALLSLTIFRIVPTMLSLLGTPTDRVTRLFLAWFGPRGIASILYVIIAVQTIGSIKGHETIYAVISLTILLSIFAHGLSAGPLASLYARYIQQKGHQE